MPKTYEQLISEITEVTAEAFNGHEFKKIRSTDDPTEEFEVGQIMFGSERHLSGDDKTMGGTVDITEQYILKHAGTGIFYASHCLELGWGNYDDSEIMSVDLDRGELNDSNGYRYTGEAALSMANHALDLLHVVKPAKLNTVPENDLSEVERHLTEAALERQVALNKMSAAVADSLLGHVALIQHRGQELSEEAFDRFVATIKLRHGLTDDEVDKAVDLRMLEIATEERSRHAK